MEPLILHNDEDEKYFRKVECENCGQSGRADIFISNDDDQYFCDAVCKAERYGETL